MIRGLALCGILVANVQPIAHVGDALVARTGGGDGAETWLGLLVHQRFFPIFSLLFGVGFSLLLESAGRRTGRPRLLLLRRLLTLLALGLAHMFLLWFGDILTVYAVVGLVVLLPSSWLPRWAVAGLAGVLIVAALVIGAGSYGLVPGLFLLGSALTRYGVIARIESGARGPALLFLVFAAAALPVAWVQQDTGNPKAMALAGLLTAGACICGVLLLLRTPLRSSLRVLFAPLGRMALTNYLSATALVLLIARLLGGPAEGWSTGTVLVIAGGILALQWVWSTLWLRRFRQGPLEWLWRWATWARRPPLRVSDR
ncbi:DUF418 domain-containing protein [Actinomadura sp. ATCC 31491]|uniref:DUF418 domain-containing protein n=1 Tax=Actinomadura luzonensis TaxID=2805427 RepID=A0ABT0G472_9ACTN|nr:DUF418 domain-containing protein [Actinomadura luzonensis]MCK2219394.1 DUF418 domain-containing protein [Actinomadura luzonensis]